MRPSSAITTTTPAPFDDVDAYEFDLDGTDLTLDDIDTSAWTWQWAVVGIFSMCGLGVFGSAIVMTAAFIQRVQTMREPDRCTTAVRYYWRQLTKKRKEGKTLKQSARQVLRLFLARLQPRRHPRHYQPPTELEKFEAKKDKDIEAAREQGFAEGCAVQHALTETAMETLHDEIRTTEERARLKERGRQEREDLREGARRERPTGEHLFCFTYLYLPLLTFTYLYLPLLTFTYLYLPLLTFTYLYLPLLTFTYLLTYPEKKRNIYLPFT
jgi:hypothetical protein